MLRSYRVACRHDVLVISMCIGKGGICGTISRMPPNTAFKYRPDFFECVLRMVIQKHIIIEKRKRWYHYGYEECKYTRSR